jgi:hypothetical protein
VINFKFIACKVIYFVDRDLARWVGNDGIPEMMDLFKFGILSRCSNTWTNDTVCNGNSPHYPTLVISLT